MVLLMTTTNWTHTATLTATTPVGPEQFGKKVAAGETVTLWQDPAQQDGDSITFRYGNYTGAARVANLSNIEAK